MGPRDERFSRQELSYLHGERSPARIVTAGGD
jgi:hypothetical protein